MTVYNSEEVYKVIALTLNLSGYRRSAMTLQSQKPRKAQAE